MATFDISRVAFDPRKHYSSVRMQQGRVLTDDDWNENERIENEERRRTRVDVIGPYGSPDAGFRIENLRWTSGVVDFDIQAGILHLGGLRLEVDDPEAYRLQKDWLQQAPDSDPVPQPGAFTTDQERFDLVYLEAWQQPVSAIEDDSLFEVALGGLDTTTRVRSMRRVRIQPNVGVADCAEAWEKLQEIWKDSHLGEITPEFERVPDVRLTVSFTEAGVSDDLCSPSAAGGYLGAENQAIRVQLTGPDTFTWGFDNAAPLYRITVSEGGIVTMRTEPKDQYHWPLAGQVVELLPWSAVLSNGQKVAAQKGHFSTVSASYNPDTGRFTLTTPPPSLFGSEWKSRSDQDDLAQPEEYFYLRVWNRGTDTGSLPEISLTVGNPIPLGTTGVQVQFDGNDRITEDYWVITVRPETPTVIVPNGLTQGMPPFGVRRFFAPLAVIRWYLEARQVQGEIVHDCRKPFRPLTDLECCCTYTVGDGVHSRGDFNSIEEALRHLPEGGGKLCVLSGIHEANVVISRRSRIRITGCGEHTIVRPRAEREGFRRPIFRIEHAQSIQLDSMTLVTMQGTAIEVEDVDNELLPSHGITLNDNHILALTHAIRIRLQEDRGGDNDIAIYHNRIGMLDKPEGEVAIFSIADQVRIERNRIVVVPAPGREDPTGPVGEGDPGGVFDPCFDPNKLYKKNSLFKYAIKQFFLYVSVYVPAQSRTDYQTPGGIQIGGTSERVRIVQNEIIGGWGNGITLGHLTPWQPESNPFNNTNSQFLFATNWSSERFKDSVTEQFHNTLYEIAIEENHIQQMGLSGIGVVAFLSSKNIGLVVRVEDLCIYRNVIQRCALRIPTQLLAELLDEAAYGGIVLAACENACIRENRVEENGISHREPVCGIFVLHGDKIEISNNRVINNGIRSSEANEDVRRGLRGGIVIRMAFKLPDFRNKLLLDNQPSVDGIPAAKIHDNIVSQPLGHALFLMAFGPVSVVSNQFTSQGTDIRNVYSLLGGSVFLMNLGISKDLILLLLGFIFKYMANANTGAAGTTVTNSKIRDIIRILAYLPNGKVMFTANQTTLDMRSPDVNLGISSQMIVSLDDIAFNNNQSECAALLFPEPPTFDIVLLNTFLIGVSIRSNDNHFSDGLTLTKYSLFSYGLLNTATGNQSTHCLHVLGARTEISENIVLLSGECEGDKRIIGNKMGVKTS
jgi:hypothetical protein